MKPPEKRPPRKRTPRDIRPPTSAPLHLHLTEWPDDDSDIDPSYAPSDTDSVISSSSSSVSLDSEATQ